MSDELFCTIVLPVYKEEQTVKCNLRGIWNTLLELTGGGEIELIVADNGGDGTTGHIVRTLFGDTPAIKYEYVPQKGRGPALNRAFAVARGRFVAVMSIDRAWDERFVAKALALLEAGQCDVVYGPKSHKDSSVKRPWYRLMGSLCVRAVLLVLFCGLFPDTQCVKVFRRRAVPFLGQMGSYNYFAETEFYLRAMAEGIRCCQIPVSVRDSRPDSKVGWRSFGEFIREAWHFRMTAWGKVHRGHRGPRSF